MATYGKGYVWKGQPRRHRVTAVEDVDCRAWWRIWSRRSSIPPEFINSIRIYNGKSQVRCKITKGKVGHKSNDFMQRLYHSMMQPHF
ncbi:hypothetical protein AMTRI_Chr10g4130 [Amborella trichopoda]